MPLPLDLLRRLEPALFDKRVARVMQHKVILENVKRPNTVSTIARNEPATNTRISLLLNIGPLEIAVNRKPARWGSSSGLIESKGAKQK